ncbi:hypothetical protein PoB_001174200 [Plakobranchus ocellatus]|uniref:Uncharacterized protein n=1 Tax=Plakobranchus ocellatus TaxID=259542 RepID=A0AAV3YSW2_9GAST|nr:hypothetical protein PoB_001174200 [Plakobranchus ocellatus]
MWVIGGSMASDIAPIICRDFSVVRSSLTPTLTLDKGLEAWDHLVVGGQYTPTTKASSLRLSVVHVKYPLTSTSCHAGALAKICTAYEFSSPATVVSIHACNLLARVGTRRKFSPMWR